MSATTFSSELLATLVQQGHQSPRKRQHQNIHKSFDDPCQRFLNAVGTDSYIRPHRHALDPKTEDLFAVRGAFALVLFDERGGIAAIERFGTEKHGGEAGMAVGVELAPGAWHTVLALTEGAVLLELKAGPFIPTAAKEFAPWAPEEGSAHAASYLATRHRQVACWPADTVTPAEAA